MARRRDRCRLDAADEAQARYAPRGEQIVEHVVAGLVDIGIDLMSGQVPGFGREAYADIAADLADPDGLSIESHVCRPQAQVEALIEACARALQGGNPRAPLE